MRNILKMLIIVVIIGAFTLPVSAMEPEEYIEEFEKTLPEGFEELLSGELESRVGPEAILYEIRAVIVGKGSLISAFFMTLLGSLAMSSLAGLCPERTREAAVRGVSIVTGILVGSSLCALLLDAAAAQSEANRFFSSLVPLLSAITLAGGGVKSAAVGAAGMNTVVALVGGGLTAALSAIGGFSVAMSLAASAGGSGALTVSRSAKGLFSWLFGIAAALLMGTLSLQTLISGTSDTAAMRTAKYMASSVIPIAGGTVSASLSTLASGLSYVKGIVGGGAIFVLLMLFLSPLIMLLLYRLALSLAVSLARLAGLSSSAECFSSFLGAIDLTVAVYAVSMILYVFEIVLFIKSGVAAL